MSNAEQIGVGKGVGIVGAGMVFQQAMSFVSGIVVARLLGAADYGIFNLVRNIAGIAVVFTKAGLDIGLHRRLGERLSTESASQAGQISLSAVIVVFVLSLLWLFACLTWVADYLATTVYQYKDFAEIMVAMMIIVPAWSLLQVVSATFRARLIPRPGVIGEMIIQPALRLGLSVTFILLGWGIFGAVWANVGAAFVALVYVGHRAAKHFSMLNRNVWSLPWRELWAVRKYSMALGLSVVIVMLTKSVDTLILGKYANASDVGRYALIQTCAVLLTLFGAAFGQLLGPQIAHLWSQGRKAETGELLQRNTRLIVATTIPLFMIFVFHGKDLMSVFGADYVLSQAVIAALAAGQLVTAVLGNAGWVLSMTGKHDVEVLVLVVGLIAALVLNMILVPYYGSLGASIATVVSISLANGIRVLIVYRYAGFLPFNSSVFSIIGFSLALAVVVKLASLALGNLHGLVVGIVASTLYAGIYGIGIFRLWLDEEERDWVYKMLSVVRPTER